MLTESQITYIITIDCGYMKCSQLDKKMKKLLIASIGIFTLGLGLASAADKDAKQTAYVATMTGVT